MKRAGLCALASVWLCLTALWFAACAARKSAGNSPVNSPPAHQDFSITATWSFDFTNFVACSGTVTKGCVSGFTWGYLQGTAQVPLKTSAASVCTGSSAVAGSPPSQPETCTDSTNGTLGIGPVTFYVVANYVDNAGNSGVTSADQSAPQNVALLAPSGLAVSWQ